MFSVLANVRRKYDGRLFHTLYTLWVHGMTQVPSTADLRKRHPLSVTKADSLSSDKACNFIFHSSLDRKPVQLNYHVRVLRGLQLHTNVNH